MIREISKNVLAFNGKNLIVDVMSRLINSAIADNFLAKAGLIPDAMTMPALKEVVAVETKEGIYKILCDNTEDKMEITVAPIDEKKYATLAENAVMIGEEDSVGFIERAEYIRYIIDQLGKIVEREIYSKGQVTSLAKTMMDLLIEINEDVSEIVEYLESLIDTNEYDNEDCKCESCVKEKSCENNLNKDSTNINDETFVKELAGEIEKGSKLFAQLLKNINTNTNIKIKEEVTDRKCKGSCSDCTKHTCDNKCKKEDINNAHVDIHITVDDDDNEA